MVKFQSKRQESNMGAVKNHYWEEISSDFLKRNEPKYDPQLVAEAQQWYQEFTGGIGKSPVEDILDMYVLLERNTEKVVDR